jgi:hypothetical protein
MNNTKSESYLCSHIFVHEPERLYHSLFCRTLRAISAGGFFTSIHNITEVAAESAYLRDVRTQIGI